MLAPNSSKYFDQYTVACKLDTAARAPASAPHPRSSQQQRDDATLFSTLVGLLSFAANQPTLVPAEGSETGGGRMVPTSKKVRPPPKDNL